MMQAVENMQDILKIAGFGDDATALYLRIVQDGATTGGELARVSRMARATVYDALGKLVEQGLVRQSLYRGVKRYTAEPVSRVSDILDDKIARLTAAQTAFAALRPALEARRAAHFVPPSLQMFDGPEAVRNILNDMLLYRDLDTRSFWPIAVAIDALSAEFFRAHNARRIENNIRVKAIWPQSRTVDIAAHPYLGSGRAHLRETRIAPLNIDFAMGYWIYGTRVAFLSSKSEAVGFIIESREMAEMMSVQHKIMWKLSTPIEK